MRFASLMAFGALSFAQTAVTPQFEVASVKLSADGPDAVSGIHTGNGRIEANNVTLKRCILGAYGVGPHQIAGGPEWIDTERFQILAKAEQPIDDDAALMQMLQVLLAERFKLTLHRESKTMSAYVLEVGKNGPKLQPPSGGEAVTNTSSSNIGAGIAADNTGMDSFARILSRKMDLPVIDRTGLSGAFKIKLNWSLDNVAATAELPSIFTAIQEQLGLRLTAQKVPVEVLVIDHAEKPSAN